MRTRELIILTCTRLNRPILTVLKSKQRCRIFFIRESREGLIWQVQAISENLTAAGPTLIATLTVSNMVRMAIRFHILVQAVNQLRSPFLRLEQRCGMHGVPQCIVNMNQMDMPLCLSHVAPLTPPSEISDPDSISAFRL